MNQESPNQELPVERSLDHSGMAIASLVLGIVSYFPAMLGPLGVVLPILGIIFGALALHSRRRTMALWGMCLSIVSLALALAFVVFAIGAFAMFHHLQVVKPGTGTVIING